MKRTIKLILLYILSYGSLMSQDVHFTNYRTVTNFFNPAQTGDFRGYLKLQVASRTQYQRTYEHGVAGVELNFISPINKNHWIGAGFNLNYDKTGSLALKTTGGGLNVAYHIPIDKKQNNVISIGAAINRFSLTANTDQYRSESTLLGIPDNDRNVLNDFNANALSIHSGVHLKSRIDKKNVFEVGFAVIHLNNPTYKILGGNDDASLGSRFNIHTTYKTEVSKVVSLQPAVYLSFAEKQSNVNIQMLSEWRIAKKNKWKGILGLSHRMGESLDFITGYATERLYISLSFDVLTSQSVDFIPNPGGIELGAFYILFKPHTPKLKPIIFCPRL
jgi:type IX secretion system PorP/SprF family membrane protein